MTEGHEFFCPANPNSVNKHFIKWALHAIHGHPEDEVWTKNGIYYAFVFSFQVVKTSMFIRDEIL